MKKVLFTFFFFSLMVVGAQAQKAGCAKTCTKSEAAACAAKAPSSTSMAANCHESSAAAAKVDAMDESIESRVDPATGHTYYVRKEASAPTGDASYVNVTFDPVTNTFVNVPEGEAVKATTTGKKSCAGAASGKACCASKGAAASTTKTTEKVKS